MTIKAEVQSEGSSDVHVSSVVIWTQPDSIADVVATLSAWLMLRVHACPSPGKIVITLETNTYRDIFDSIDQINALPGVLAANLVYHQVENADAMAEELHA